MCLLNHIIGSDNDKLIVENEENDDTIKETKLHYIESDCFHIHFWIISGCLN